MVKDTKLYDLLGVSPTADENELKKGYRKAALKYHPDKPTGDEEKFKDVGEAYDILSNKDKRAVYDQYGLDAARTGQVPMPDFGGAGAGAGAGGFPGAGGGQRFSTGGMPGGATFSFGGPGGSGGFSSADAFNLFNAFGMGGMGGGGGAEMDDDPLSSLFGGARGGASMGGMPRGGRSGRSKSARMHEPVEPKLIDLSVALRDLYTGTTKKLKLRRRGMNGESESETLEVQIKPGWKPGTKLTYKGRGDVQPDGSAQDIIFVIQEKPDPDFSREDDDLKIKLKLSLKEALTGFTRVVTTLDGKKLKVSQGRPAQPNQIFTFPGRGMPKSKFPGQFGDLKVELQVEFPTSLTPEQKAAIEQNF